MINISSYYGCAAAPYVNKKWTRLASIYMREKAYFVPRKGRMGLSINGFARELLLFIVALLTSMKSHCRALASISMSALIVLFGSLLITVIGPTTQYANAFSCRDFVDAPIAVSGNDVYVVWTSNKTGNWEVLFRASHDNGRTFDDKINISKTPLSDSFHADIAAFQDNVYVSWHDNKTGDIDTYTVTSHDKGKTWGQIILIKGTGSLPQPSRVLDPNFNVTKDSMENTRIAASENNTYIVSWDRKSGNWEVFLSRSNDGGDTYLPTINLSNSSDALSEDANVHAHLNNLYVTWWETYNNGSKVPMFISSNDGGATFNHPTVLSSDGSLPLVTTPELGPVALIVLAISMVAATMLASSKLRNSGPTY
jgi:hypothetical protein